MEAPAPLVPTIDFSKYQSPGEPTKLILWEVFKTIGFIRGISERYFLAELKKFLTSASAKKIIHFNFEKNFAFETFDDRHEKDFEVFIEAIAGNASITVLEIGNNYIPPTLMAKLAHVITAKNALLELSFRMHWPGFMQSRHNIEFITHLSAGLSRNVGLSKLDLSGNHINKAGLIALADACKKLAFLTEVNLTGVTYVKMDPDEVYFYWLEIQDALMRNLDEEEAISNLPPTPPQTTPTPRRRKLIVNSDDEDDFYPPDKVYKSDSKNVFFCPSKESATSAKTFSARLHAIDIDIRTTTVFGVRAIELVYYEQVDDKLYCKFMNEPYTLFYSHEGNTHCYNYDGSYIRPYVRSKLQDPLTQRYFEKHLMMPNPVLKKEIEKLITDLEKTYASRRTFRY